MIQKEGMTFKKINLATNILIWIILVLTAYLAENVVLFDSNNFQRGFSLLEYVLLFVGVISIISYFFYIEYKQNKIGIKWFFISLLSIILIGAIIGIFLTPETQTYQVIEIIDEVETIVVKRLVVSVEEKFISALFVIVAGIGVYIQVVILPRLINTKKYILFLMYIIVSISLITALLSYVLDFESYVHLYKHGLVGYIYPQSFLFNRNMYALMMLLGMLALYNIISFKPTWYNYLFLIFLFVNIMFTFSKAATGIALITFFVHFVYRMIASFKNHRIRNIIFLCLCGIGIICGVLLIPFPFLMNVALFNEVRRFILEYYFELGVGSYDYRSEIWDSVINLSTGVHLWLGRGLIIFNKTLTFYTGEVSASRRTELFSHNGFLETLGQWGLLGAIPYSIGVFSIFCIIIYVAIKDYKTGIPSLIVFGAFLGYTMVETSTLFDLTIEGVTTTVLVAIPSLSWLYNHRHPEVNREIVKNAESIEYKMAVYDVNKFEKRATKYVALLLGLSIIFAFYYFSISNSEIINYLMFVVIIITVFIILPRTIANAYALINKNKGVLFWVLTTLVSLIDLGAMALFIIIPTPLILIIVVPILLINLLMFEKLFRRDYASFKTYLSKSILHSLVILLIVSISGSIVVLLVKDLTWFVLAEIALLDILLMIPFISKLNNNDSKLNKHLLMLFARDINR